MGRTITTDAKGGNVVIVILSISTSVAVAQVWQLLEFIIHQWRAKGIPADGLFWQQQALLRTLPTPFALAADSVQLWWRWKESHRALLRSLTQILLAISFIIGSLAASIFSSYLVKTSNIEILVSSPKCALLNLTDLGYGYLETTMPILRSYAEDCYQPGSFLPARCHNIFTRPSISIAKTRTSCPWLSSMCLQAPIPGGEQPAVALDTGMVDMGPQLGANFPRKDSVKFRRVTTCSILPLEGHSAIVNESITQGTAMSGEKILALRYGAFSVPVNGRIIRDTFTFSLSNNLDSRGYMTE